MTERVGMVITYALDTFQGDEADAFVMLRQKDWGRAGKTSSLDIVKSFSSLLAGWGILGVDCGMDETEEGDESSAFTTELYAYPWPADLDYKVRLSYGFLGVPAREEIEVREQVHFNLENTQSTEYPIYQLISKEWAVDTLNERGGNSGRPVIFASGNELQTDRKVYGTVNTVYTTIRHTRLVKISARTGAVDNVFSSMARASWDGGVDTLSISPPHGAESNYGNNENCQGGSSTTIEDDDGDDVPTARPTNRTVGIDYCSQEPTE